MANTNRPTVNTHQHVIVPPNGDAILGRTTTRFRYYNNYPIVEKQLGQDPKYYVKRRPACEPTGIQVTTAPQPNQITSVYHDPSNKYLWFVNNRTPTVVRPGFSTVYKEDTNRLSAPSISNPAIMPHSSIEKYAVGSTKWVVIGEHSPGAGTDQIHYYDEDGNWDETVNVGAAMFCGNIVFLDGYLFYASNIDGGQRIYNSTLGNPKEWLTGASFIDAEMVSDQIVTLARHHNHLVAFGRKSIEFFYNSANEIGSPLTRQIAYATTDVGLYNFGNPGSFTGDHQSNALIEIGDTIYFIGISNSSIVGLFKIDNFKITKVSDAAMDEELRTMMYPKLGTFDLEGEICPIILDQALTNIPLIYIPSREITVEFQWSFMPTNAIAGTSWGRSFGTMLFKTDGLDKNCMYFSGDYQYVNYLVLQQETISSQYVVDYLDFNNNANKHWKYVDVLGSFGTNQVAIGYRNDKYGYENASLVNLPYMTASDAGPTGNIRFRNLGYSRRQGYVVFISGSQDYLYKGVAVGYNQWGD